MKLDLIFTGVGGQGPELDLAVIVLRGRTPPTD